MLSQESITQWWQVLFDFHQGDNIPKLPCQTLAIGLEGGYRGKRPPIIYAGGA